MDHPTSPTGPAAQDEDVRALHERLARLGFGIDAGEVEAGVAGPSTRQAVAAFQERCNADLAPGEEPLPVSGEVDAATARALAARARARVQAFTVHGRVTERSSAAALAGLRVEVWDHDRRRHDLLGIATTDGEGRYRVRFDARYFAEARDDRPDVYLKVFRGDELVHTGDPVFNAPEETEIAVALDPAAPAPQTPTVRDLLDAAAEHLPPAARERAAGAADGAAPADDAFWSALRGDPDAEGELRAAARLLQLTGGSVPLARELRARAGGRPAAQALAEMRRGEWREAVERALGADGELPAGLPGEAREERVEALAARLADAAARAFPTAFLAARLAEGPRVEPRALAALAAVRAGGEGAAAFAADAEVDAAAADEAVRREARMFPELDLDAALAEAAETGTFRNPLREGVARVLAAHPEVDLATARVEDLLRGGGRAGLAAADAPAGAGDEALLATLRRIQRVFQVAPAADQVSALMGEGIHSALAVSRMGRDAFVRGFAGALGGDDAAARVHEAARRVTAASTHLFASFYQAASDATPMVMGGSAAAASLAKQVPDWATLFGRLELCDCPHCRSVYSPAAYFVDLLEFLDQPQPARRTGPGLAALASPPPGVPGGGTPPPGGGGGGSPLPRPIQVLTARRPDLQHIALTCENTNTVLPYVDLVNEVLESFVAHGAPRPNDTSGAADADALSVAREYGPQFPETTSEHAYYWLARAPFPFSLPFDRHTEAARAWLQHLGTGRHELLRAFGREGAEVEYLRLPPGVVDAFTGRLGQLWTPGELWGYDVGVTFPGRGLRGEYYAGPDLAGAPLATRIDPAVAFDWGDAQPVPGTGDLFSVRWTGQVYAPVDGVYRFHTLTDDGVRLWVNGVLLVDRWDTLGEFSAEATLVGGGWYDLKVEYRDTAWLARAELSWTVPGEARSPIAPRWLRSPQEWHEHLSWVPELLRRTGLAFTELLELLATRWVNPDPAAPRVKLRALGDPADLDLTWIVGLRADDGQPLDRIHRFVRLWRALGIPMRDLDRALLAFGPEPVAFLERMGTAARVRDALASAFGTRVSLVEALSLWAPIDTEGADSLYATLFRNRAVASSLDPDLELVNGEVAGTGRTLDDKAALIAAALRVPAAELAAARAAAGLGAGTPLSLAALSRLHRRVLLARALRVPAAELAALERFTGCDPFASPAATLELVERVREVRGSGFTTAQLEYLLRDVASPASGQRPSAGAWTLLARTLRGGLARVAEDTAPAPDPEGGRLRDLLGAELPGGRAALAMRVVDGESGLDPEEQAAFLEAEAPFIPVAVRQRLLLPLDSGSPEADREERREAVRGALLERRRDAAGRALAAQTLAETLELELPVATLLLEEVLAAAPGSGERAMGAFLALHASDDAEVGAAALRVFTRLRKTARLVGRLGLGAAQVRWVVEHGADFGGVHWDRLPVDATPSDEEAAELFAHWRRLRELAEAQRALPGGDVTLLDVFAAARADGATPAGVLAVLADASGWDPADLAAAAAVLELAPADLANAAALPALRAVLGLARTVGVPVAHLAAWAAVPPDAAQAAALRDAAKARYDRAGWVRAAAPVVNGLRDRQRDALVAYVLRHPVIRARGIADANALFEHFLIDVEMGTAMKTSRIKQAISSVQLFVQRCLLNLEPEVEPASIDAELWEWMKSYGTWEANRKVFLYPENWLEPGVRDDKTPFFRELESDLLQSDATPGDVEDALRGYVEKLDEIGRMEMVGLARGHEYFGDDYLEVLHAFARTYGEPHVHYYRRRERGAWTPWEKLDLEIPGNHLVPVHVWGRVHLLWPVFEKVSLPMDNPTGDGSQGSQPRHRWEIRLATSEYKDGRWTPKRVFPEALRTAVWGDGGNYLASTRNIALRGSFSSWGGQLGVDVVSWRRGDWENEQVVLDGVGQFLLSTGRNMDRLSFGGGTVTWNAPRYAFLRNMGWAVSGSTTPLVVPTRDDYQGPVEPRTFLGSSDGWYELLAPAHIYQVSMTWWPTLFYQDRSRTYFAETVEGDDGVRRLRFAPHWHPHSRTFVARLNQKGISGLLATDTQGLDNRDRDGRTPFERVYAPTDMVVGPLPEETVEFRHGEAYAVYNWELFFHLPVLIADRLIKEQRFAEAQRWLHHVFNPVGDFDEPSPQRYWRFLPFHRTTEVARIQDLLETLADPAADPARRAEVLRQVDEWRHNPFQPHAVARLRPGAYQKAVVMKYLDNLIAWGDHLFAQDTIESINEATQLYVLAGHILGARPERVPEMAPPAPKTYAQLAPALDAFSNAVVDAQNRFPFVSAGPVGFKAGGGVAGALGLGRTLYFGIPRNDRLLAYWDRVEDRLTKIRSSQNLQGVTRSLALFEPALDPGLLVRAGLDGALSELNAPLGHYRFSHLLPRAAELCAEVRTLGGALLSALEKKDAEALSALRAGQETSMLRLVRLVRERQVEEARASLEGLRRTREVVKTRYDHYSTRPFLNAFEAAQLTLLTASTVYQTAGQISSLAGSVSRLIPDFDLGVSGWAGSPVVKARYGGSNVGAAAEAFAAYMQILASVAGAGANMSATMGAHQRRADEWELQESLALREMEQIDKQIEAAEVRLAITERELANHDRQVEHAEAVEQFLRSKFTGQELYGWMVTQLSGLYFQAYQMAYAAAKRAERAFRFEHGLTDSGFVQFGHWDSLRRGLLAGERLQLELKRLEMAHIDQNAREHELTRHVSLAVHDPLALVALKQTGRCQVELPEALFDLDHPGHYMRRIRTVSLTIPCVTGPYTGINARLTLLSSRIRVDGNASGPYEPQEEDTRFLVDHRATQSLATSHAQNDSGMFELSFRDERYLPFEGAGAVSRWLLELPAETNPFDFDTITDVVLKVGYTARQGGELLRRAALEAAVLPPPSIQPGGPAGGAAPAQDHLQRIFNARHEFADDWRRFLHPAATAASQRLQLRLTPERFPYRFRGRSTEMRSLDVFLRLRDGVTFPEGGTGIRIFLRLPDTPADLPPEDAGPEGVLHPDPALGGILHATLGVADAARGFGDWTFEVVGADLAGVDPALVSTVTVNGTTYRRLRPEAVEDLTVVCGYATA